MSNSDIHSFTDQHKIIDKIAPAPTVKQTGESSGLCAHCHVLDDGTCPILDQADLNGFDGLEQCEMFAVIERVFKSGINFEHYGHSEGR